MIRPFSYSIPVPPDYRQLPISDTLDIEIGCGVGFHPLQYAKKFPKRLLIAFERTSEKFKKFQLRFQNHDSPNNLIPIHGDAVNWLAQKDFLGKVDKIFIFYPNPYPKSSQKNLRWGFSPASQLLVDCLKENGQIIFRSNKASYLEELRNAWPKIGLILEVDRLIDPASIPATHFEKKYLSRGEQCWELIWKKTTRS